jgi:probable phosphoglycerate mutase
MSIYLLRHGFDTDDFKSGWSDVGLTDLGIEQSKKAATYLQRNNIKIKKIVSSDLKRAMDTADIVEDIIKTKTIYNPQFREFNPGLLSGMRYEDINKDFSEFKVGSINMYRNFPLGESPVEFYKRVKECLKNLDEDCLYVTHRLVIEVMYHITNEMEWNINEKKFAIEQGSLHEYSNGTIKKLSL